MHKATRKGGLFVARMNFLYGITKSCSCEISSCSGAYQIAVVGNDRSA